MNRTMSARSSGSRDIAGNRLISTTSPLCPATTLCCPPHESSGYRENVPPDGILRGAVACDAGRGSGLRDVRRLWSCPPRCCERRVPVLPPRFDPARQQGSRYLGG